ncbi:MAG: hypothetical protein ACXIUD_02680 [Mongoliitalea sp.]
MLQLLIFILITSFTHPGDVKLVYLDDKPEDVSLMTYVEMKGLDQLEACESIMLRLEKVLKKLAKEQSKEVVTIYVVEQIRPQIQTESQFGRIGKVSILYNLD